MMEIRSVEPERVWAYFFLAIGFFAGAFFLPGFLLLGALALAVALLVFFLPKADAQLAAYFSFEPMRVMVIFILSQKPGNSTSKDVCRRSPKERMAAINPALCKF